ncbi:hypothetical protein [Streptomyces buecherae]|uniref:Uncharacterized protein n=1 Tax=Streptomyces buecherae TaxID=2763006 RepID=A0A7H8N7U8_9ACTN|nr:hypothetical protein [Streptomyces buecherae]QKW50423.1 hypothetical protein HUT08_13770 [Streptomyces buecherae]
MNEPEENIAEVRRALSAGIAEAGGGNRQLLRLTDEELAVIDPVAPGDGIASSPHLFSLTEAERELAIATALRSLVSRELIEIGNIEELEDLMRVQESAQGGGDTGQRTPVDISMADEAVLVLNLRRSAERVLAGDATTSGGTAHIYVYIHSADLFLVERVTSGGMHLFTATNSIEDAAELVQAMIDPFGMADKDGPAKKLDPHALDRENVGPPLQRVIDNALVVGRLFVLSDSHGMLVMTYATEREVWTVTVDEPHSPQGIVAKSVSTRSLGRKVRKLLRLPHC